MSDKWEQTTLGEVCEVIAGQSPRGSNYNVSGKGLPFYQGKKQFGKKYIGSPVKWTTQVTQEALAGDVLMSVRAPVGPINFATERICIGRGLAAIRAKKQIHRDFVFYLLLSKQNEIKGTEGAVFASINKTQIENIQISKPPLAEQKKIVAILDEAFAAIETATANTKKNLANAKELFESQLDQVFGDNAVTSGWNKIPLEDLCEFRNGLWKGKKPPYVHVGVIRNTNFTKSCTLNDDNIAYLDVEESKFANRQLQFGDLILERSGGGPNQPVGRVVTFEKTEGLFSFSNFTSVIRVADPLKLSFQFLYRALCWYYFSGATEGMQHRSTGIRNLNFTTYKQLQIPFPPIVKQKRIATTLDKAFVASENLTQIGKQKLAHLADLKQSILHKAFSGELTADSKATNL